MTILAKLLGVVLILVALLCGGCSIVFTGFALGDLSGGAGILPIWGAGLLVAAVCIWGGVALLRYRGPAAAENVRPDEGDTKP